MRATLRLCLPSDKWLFLTLTQMGVKSMSSYNISASATKLYRNIMMPDALVENQSSLCISELPYWAASILQQNFCVYCPAYYPITHLLHMSRWVIGCCSRGRMLQWVMNASFLHESPIITGTHIHWNLQFLCYYRVSKSHLLPIHSYAQRDKGNNKWLLPWATNRSFMHLEAEAELKHRSLARTSYTWFFQQSRAVGIIFLLLKWCENLSHYCFQQWGVRVMSIQCSSERFH